MNRLMSLALVAVSASMLAACNAEHAADTRTADQLETDPGHTAAQDRDLATFDDLDFRVYSKQEWDDLHLSHAEDIVVHYPDGSTTTGIADHIARLEPQFAFAPDTHIPEHPIKLADGEYTAVQGTLQGTFTQPMDLGGGQVMQPTGKPFSLSMVTIGHWKDGVMDEEWLYYDNAAFMAQISAD